MKQIIFAIIILCSCLRMNAQDHNVIINYDFKPLPTINTGSVISVIKIERTPALVLKQEIADTVIEYEIMKTKKMLVKEQDKVVFKIDNINTFFYDVTFVTENKFYQTDRSPVISKIFGLESNGDTTPEAEIESRKGNKIMEAALGAASFAGSPDGILLDSLYKACSEYKDVIVNLKRLDVYKKGLMNLIKDPTLNFEKAKEKMLLLGIPSDDELDQIYFDYVLEYDVMEIKYEKIESGVSNASKNAVKQAYGAMEKAHEEIVKGNYDELLTFIKNLRYDLLQPESYTLQSAPVQAKGDEIKFKVIINKKSGLYEGNYTPIEFTETIRVKGGLKVDFSVGPVFNFKGKNNLDDIYYTVARDSGNIGIKTIENKNVIRHGLAAFIHLSPKVHTSVSPAFSFGAGVDYDKQDELDFSFYFGLGTILGRKEKVILQVGLSLIKIHRLNPLLEKDKEYESSYLEQLKENDKLTNEVYRPRGFFSISYNITSN